MSIQAAPGKKGGFRARIMREKDGYLFVLPQMLLFAIFLVYPIFEGARLSLYESSLYGTEFVGLSNYKRLFTDPVFHTALFNTLMFVIWVTLLVVVVGFIISASIYDKRPGFVSFIRGAYYIPTVLSMVVMSVIWMWLLNPAMGLVNHYIAQMGGTRINFMGDMRYALPLMIFMVFMGNLGQGIILYIASMLGIDTSLFEAAKIDGANSRQIIRHIIFPLTLPTTSYISILTTISVIKVFVVIDMMTGGGPNNASTTLMYLCYREAFRHNNVGYASAIGMVMFAIVLCMSLVQLRATTRKEI